MAMPQQGPTTKAISGIFYLKQNILGDKLKPQFDTPSGLPATYLNFTTNELAHAQFVNPLNNVTYNSTNTEIAGTIILDFRRLSDLTGDESFRLLSPGWLINPPPIYPGLVGSELDIETGNYLTIDFGWNGGIDSFFEYLIKMYYYNSIDITGNTCKDFCATAAQSIVKHIALHPHGHPELTFISQGDVAGNLEWQMDDYSCFAGGNLLLGGTLLDLPEIRDLGLAVPDTCHLLCNNTASGLGPLSWTWYNRSNQAYDPSNDNDDYRKEGAEFGYFSINGYYTSFLETIESIFYSCRITGGHRWLEYN
ncbi:glycoside hydrolase family 47 protein [Oidiodendron maius Zn]|uniref:alpha-1,2-Mannosidase n=1 Tax=Oidiodendron maius (strain Zn) TaxID=913774 RepID=A0A0C3I1J2_OIDMZ|nr:glycoside hydrolase family 47 protein [Oidiodendron maius Zn]